jgi:alpha-amylase
MGRDLAPNKGLPKNQCSDGLINAADWLTRALDIQGYRLDNTKGVSTEFIQRLLNHTTMQKKFAVGEFADGNVSLIENWANAVQHRSAAFDFPLHFVLKDMCNNSSTFDMASLDHAGLAGGDPGGAVTFVENHDTDRGGVGGPIVRNKLLAYAYILTSEGYPCVFYRDYSTDKNCFGLKPEIDSLIWLHEHLASGPTEQRWKDSGVFAFERLGGRHLVVGLNKDENASRTIRVQTGFGPHAQLKDFSGQAASVTTDGSGMLAITIPKNAHGKGYVCYAPHVEMTPFVVNGEPVTQEYEGASDLDIKPAVEGERVPVSRIFVAADAIINIQFFFDTAHWNDNTAIQLDVEDPTGTKVKSSTFNQASPQGSGFQLKSAREGFYSIFVALASASAQNATPGYRVRVTFTAPKVF